MRGAAARCDQATRVEDRERVGALRNLGSAQAELARIEAGGAVDPGYSRIRADADAQWRERQEELERLAREAIDRVRDTSRGKRKKPAHPLPPRHDPKSQIPTRVFVLIWTDLTNWWERYDIDQLASELTDAEAELFFTALNGSNTFADRLRVAREHPQRAEPSTSTP